MAGKGASSVFDPRGAGAMLQRRGLKDELRRAVERGES